LNSLEWKEGEVKILVPCKRVPDTDQRIHVLPDGSDIDRSNLPTMVNPFDAIALEEALRIREAAEHDHVEVAAVSVGPVDCEKELRTCLAMGADRGMLVEVDQALDPWNVSSLLVEIVHRESPDLVLMGKQAVDDDANQTGQFLAARLGWPQATFVSRLELEGPSARVARETDAGIESLSVTLPAVITVDLRLNEPRYASLPSIMKARKKPIETIAAAELGCPIDPRLTVVRLEQASAHRTCATVTSVEALVQRLKEETKVF
jgi:electron transfer flavoprotein beta subunit